MSMAPLNFRLKLAVQACARRFGYKFERFTKLDQGRIDVFALIVDKFAAAHRDVFVLQIGANDGVYMDPIRKYITKYRWRGVLVEPQPHVFDRLRDNYADQPQLSFENAAVAERDGIATLYVASSGHGSSEISTGLSSFNRDIIVKGLARNDNLKEIVVPAMSVPTLIRKHGISHIDILQVDTEGYDFEIIKLVDAAGLLPTVIHFEHLHLTPMDRQIAFEFLRQRDYKMMMEDMDTLAYRQS